MPTLISSIIVACFCELAARIVHAPSTQFYIVSIIALVPGKPLYYTMNALAGGNRMLAASCAAETFLYASGIAAGMCIAFCIIDLSRRLRKMLMRSLP